MSVKRMKISSEKKVSKTSGKKVYSKKEIVNRFKGEVVSDYHTIPIADLCVRLETNPVTGLTAKKALDIYEKTGPNELTPCEKTPELLKFIRSITHGFSLLLWVGALLCFLGALIEYISKYRIDYENIILGIVLILIIMITGMFMYFQEHKTNILMEEFANLTTKTASVIRDGKITLVNLNQLVIGDLINLSFGDKVPADVRIIRCQSLKLMEEFANLTTKTASVIRDGKITLVNLNQLVIGDLINLSFGDKVPADVRIIRCQSLKVDNSSLSGETEPVSRSTECTSSNILQTMNVAFYSTNVVEGTAQGIVIMCGDNTVMGRVAGLTARLVPLQTPIAHELHKFMKFISIWATFLGIVFGFCAFCIGYNWLESALFLIGIIVSNVPEGLLATVAVSLAVTAKKMASKNCLVTNLEAVETLGSTSVICSDKTGTLTQNRMTVCHLWYNTQAINADTSEEQNEAKRYKSSEGFLALMRCATLCNRAEFITNSPSKPVLLREVRGDASESAILKFVELSQSHGLPEEYKKQHPKLIEIPFSSNTKYQISIHKLGSGCIAVMKGAPERIMERCKTILVSNENIALTTQLRRICDIACLEFAARGERVLGFCDLLLNDTYSYDYPFSAEPIPNFPLSGFRFVGFISLIDPPRPQVPDAVAKCRSAGIKVIMVTGDHPVTATAIAKEVGIISDETILNGRKPSKSKSIVMEGNTLRELSPDELDGILFSYKEIVFARVSPTQKLQIVEGLQRIGKIVAVTGDGVNDSPALKKANIGIAMGISGSEVSKQSADMILLDDNFATIVVGIEEGRKIFDNLKKSIVYILASNIPEITPFLMFIFLNIPLPLGVLSILCIDILTDMMPAISLAYEKAEKDIMTRPPRDPQKDSLVTFRLYFLACGYIGFIESMAGFFLYFVIMAEHGFQPNRLIGLRTEWDRVYINDLMDSYGQEWTYDERKVLEYTCSTAFMMTVVVCQWGDVIICKTRINSIMQQGMTNWILNISLIVETVLTCVLTYSPCMHYLKFYPLKLRWWGYAMPFSVFLILFDEYRKWRIRKNKKGWFYAETYY